MGFSFVNLRVALRASPRPPPNPCRSIGTSLGSNQTYIVYKVSTLVCLIDNHDVISRLNEVTFSKGPLPWAPNCSIIENRKFGRVNQNNMLQTFSVQVRSSVLIYIYCVLDKIAPIQLYLLLLPPDWLAEIFSQPLHPLVPHDNFLLEKLFKKKIKIKKQPKKALRNKTELLKM